MLGALVAGERDPVVLAELAKCRLRSKIPELREALTGRFNDHHAFMVRVHLDVIDQHTQAYDQVDLGDDFVGDESGNRVDDNRLVALFDEVNVTLKFITRKYRTDPPHSWCEFDGP